MDNLGVNKTHHHCVECTLRALSSLCAFFSFMSFVNAEAGVSSVCRSCNRKLDVVSRSVACPSAVFTEE